MENKTKIIHGACVQYHGVGILMTGPSGSGKSDLALRLIHAGGCLVADDQVIIEEGIIARCPTEIRGKLEVRGIGVISQPFEISWPIQMELCLTEFSKLKRLPEINWQAQWPQIPFDPFQQSALARIDILCGLLVKRYELVA